MRILYVLFIGIVLTAISLNAGFKEIVTPQTNIIDEIIDVQGTIYVGVHGTGVFRSTNKGNDWVDASPEIGIDKVTSLCYDGTTMFASFYNHGIYKTDNGGTTWSNNEHEINGKRITSMICNPELIIAGTDGFGVFSSSDKGENWEDISKGLLNKDVTIVIFYNDKLLAGTNTGGLYISEDLTGKWQKTDLIYEINDITVSEEGLIYVATNNGAFFSEDEGESWDELSNIYFNDNTIENVVIEERNITKITEVEGNIIIGTNDAGTYFLNEEDNTVFWDKTNLHAPISALYFDSKTEYYASDINGEFYNKQQITSSWTKRTKIKDKSEYTIFKSNGDDVLYAFSNDGKGFSSEDLGITWKELPELNYNQLYDVAGKLNNSVVLATDNGLYYTQDKGNSWSVFKAEENENSWYLKDVENNNSNNMFASLISNSGKNQLLLSNADFTQWNDVTDETAIIDKITVLQNSFIIANVGDYLAKSENYGKTFTIYPEISKVRDLIYSNDRLLAIQSSKIFTSDNGGTSFRTPQFYVDIDSDDAVFLSLAANNVGSFFSSMFSSDELGYENNYVFKSTSNGISWSNISKELPRGEINALYSDEEGNLLVSKQKLFLHKDSLILELPYIIEPGFNEYAVERNPVIKLDSIDINAYYEIEFSDDEEFMNILEQGVFSGDKYQVDKAFNYNTQIYVRLRNIFEDVHSEWLTSTFKTKLIEPSLRSPVNNSKNNEFEVELKWYPSNEAEYYRIQISESISFDEIVYEDSTDKETIITDKLESSTQFYWRVRAENDGNISNWSQIWNFTTNIGPPILIFPEDDAVNLRNHLEFIWEGKDAISKYLLQLSTSNTFEENITEEFEVDGLSKQVILNFNTQYFWRVASKQGNDQSNWSEAFTFKTGFEPVELISPENDAINVEIPISFEWTEDTGADRYEIIITETATNRVITEMVETNSYQSDEMKYDHQYLWRVRAMYGSVNSSLWSEEYSFNTILSDPVLIEPDNNAELSSNNVTLKWSGESIDNYYEYQIADDEDFNNVLFSGLDVVDNEEGINTLTINGLTRGKEYFWRVKALESSSQKASDWSEVRTFFVLEIYVDLFKPENNATNVPKKQQFVWYSVDNAIDYTLIITEVDSNNPTIEKTGLTITSIFIDELEPNTDYKWRVDAKVDNETILSSDEWNFRTDNFTSVNEDYTEFRSLEIFPNPAKQNITIKYPNQLVVNKIEIYNVAGENLFVIYNPVSSQTEINISSFTSGKYYLKLISEKGVETKIFTILK
jgi:photosystem II stability/assembly factor-like uncharacterized protein